MSTGFTSSRRGGALKRLAQWLAVAGTTIAASGCVEALEGPVATNPAAAARGEAIARQACGSCHGMGPDETSNFSGAPPFRVMRFDYNAMSYQRRMAQMHNGYVHMPPAQLTMEEVADIGAYVRSLERTSKR